MSIISKISGVLPFYLLIALMLTAAIWGGCGIRNILDPRSSPDLRTREVQGEIITFNEPAQSRIGSVLLRSGIALRFSTCEAAVFNIGVPVKITYVSSNPRGTIRILAIDPVVTTPGTPTPAEKKP